MRLLQSAVRIESNGSGSGHGSAFPDRKALPPCSCARRAKSSSHEWPRTARHGADRVSRLPGAWPACPGAAAVRGGSPHPGRSLLLVRTEDLKSPCDAPKGRIRPGVFSVHTPCLIHFNFLDWLLLAVAHVVQNQRNIRSERLRRFTNIISIEILGSRRVTSPCRAMRFQEDALVRPMDELRLLLHMVPWKSLSSD